MTENQSSYRQITKATTIFGGVQVFNIIISIIRSKFIAILLGPSGMGIMGLLTATINFISSLTNFGINISAVKDISAAFGSGDNKRIGVIVTVVKRIVWITGLIGFFSTLILSSFLSQITFGNKEYTLAFIWISATLLFKQLSSGQLVVLQGLRKLNLLAKANLTGSFIGLIVTIPLYYFWGINGIVPGIIGTSLVSLILSWYFSGKINYQKVQLTRTETIAEGKNMIKLGLLISISGLLTLGSDYIVRIFISHRGGFEQVGLYNAGFGIITTYVSLIFNAMATDYYPRLSEVASDNIKCKQTINQQAEIAILIIAPILIIFLVFIKWIIILLYSNEFIDVNLMMQIAALGMFFKATSWSVAFIFLAKGANKIFFWNELANNIYTLILTLIGYSVAGLTGVGLAFLASYFMYTIQVLWISRIYFNFKYQKSLKNIFIIQFGLALAVFLTVRFLHQPFNYYAGTILFLLSGIYSLTELNKRLGINQLIKKFIK